MNPVVAVILVCVFISLAVALATEVLHESS